MLTGKISYYNEVKKYGFITRDDGLRDVFFHVSEVLGDDGIVPRIDQVVSFSVEQGDRGPKAVNIKIL